MYAKASSSVVMFTMALTLANSADAQSTTTQLTTSTPSPLNRIDYQNAKPFPLPQAGRAAPTGAEALTNAVNPAEVFGTPGVSRGAKGNGKKMPVQLAPPRTMLQTAPGNATPEEYGASNLVYTTSQANASGDVTVNDQPFSAAGKLFFQVGGSTYLCSASLIKRGVVVTAAHCVIKFGSGNGYYANWQFTPAYNNGSGPYGAWTASKEVVLTAYANGTDPCAQSGVGCQDDVAVLVMTPQGGAYPGDLAGFFSYGWNSYGYNSSGQVQITQLGYPGALDGGTLMERNDAQGAIVASMANNTVIGSLMTEGSSGGPWVVNFGEPPVLDGASFGSAADHNVVVGVTSWGNPTKQMGAAPFTTNNIVSLVNTACAATPDACQ